MRYPDFFDAVPAIVLRDPLAEFLGAAEGGLLEYRYLDAVRLAGHSCPTVASAYTLTRRALLALYPGETPERGAVRVSFRDAAVSGVTGVMAAVATLLTGATLDTGFKGLAGRFDRRQLLAFGQGMAAEMRLSRLDTGAVVEASADLRRVPAAPEMGALMQKCLAGEASPMESAEFRRLWQERVRAVLLDHGEDDEVFRLRWV
ncbi:MAG: hypothetical protein PHU46_13035 [Rhodocyclaceae bacterium]|nr:hypothetical protein [Rhodocyclaceae bacterium]